MEQDTPERMAKLGARYKELVAQGMSDPEALGQARYEIRGYDPDLDMTKDMDIFWDSELVEIEPRILPKAEE